MAANLNMLIVTSILACMLALTTAPPLGVATMTPPNVDAVIQVRGGLQQQGAGMAMLRDGVRTFLEQLGAQARWSAAAEQAHVSGDELLRRCAGRDASLVVRREAQGSEWVLALEMQGQQACELLRSMGGRMQSKGRFEIPQLGLAGGWHGDWMLVTDRADSHLLRDMLRLATEPGQPTFASQLPADFALESDAVVTVALRHDQVASGISMWSLSPSATGLRIQMRADVAGDPCGETIQGCEPSIMLEAMPEKTLACWMQNMPTHPVPQSWCASIAEWLPQAHIQANFGQRMAVMIGTSDQEPGALAVAVAYQVHNAWTATRDHDAMLDRVAEAIARQHGDKIVHHPSWAQLQIEAPRYCDHPGLAQAVFGGIATIEQPELHARTVALKQGGWRVYASDRAWLDQVAAALEEHPESRANMVAGPPHWNRSGYFEGELLANSLDVWARELSSHGRCGRPMKLLAACVRQCGSASWRMAQPSPGTLQAVVEIQPALHLIPSAPSLLIQESSTTASKP